MAYMESLEKHSKNLKAATDALLKHGRNSSRESTSSSSSSISETSHEVLQARKSMLASVTKLQTLLAQPPDFIQNLASQIQILACLRWLGEFQILVCIPLNESIATRDVAEMTGVPETLLCRVVRLLLAFGFLREPKPGYVAHTPLSASFVTMPSYLDAAMFLAETAAPSALQMSTATHRNGLMGDLGDSAYAAAFNTSQPFKSAVLEQSRLQRQWWAYRRCTQDTDDVIDELLARLDWKKSNTACFVDASRGSVRAAVALAESQPSLLIVIQLNETVGSFTLDNMNLADGVKRRIVVQSRAPGGVQPIKDAGTYLMHLTSPIPSLHVRVLAELHAHIGILRANTAATLVLAPPLLPEPGSTVDSEVEALARLHDLSRLQLTNEGGIELSELMDLINSVHDNDGRLVIASNLRSGNSATVAVGVKYQRTENGVADPAIMM